MKMLETKKSLVTEEDHRREHVGNAWSNYYNQTARLGARETTQLALNYFETAKIEPGAALDLGCGDGRDATEMLAKGWEVLAIDIQPEAIRRLRARQFVNEHLLVSVCANFALVPWNHPLLINASLSLPFLDEESFVSCWIRIVNELEPGGIFCGHFFGARDEWSQAPSIKSVTRNELNRMLESFEVKHFIESEFDGPSSNGQMKHSHIYQIVAQRKI